MDRIAVVVFESRNPDSPWLTKDMVNILDSWLRATDIGVEFGSGRSTAWIAARVARLFTVEHDQAWSVRVQEMLRNKGVASKVRQRLADGRNIEESYMAVFSDLLDSSLDFVLVDGIFRDKCALAAISKIRPGGLLIVDNSNWYLPPPFHSRSPSSRLAGEGPATEQWSEFAEAVSTWRLIWTSNGVTDTASWIKPYSG